MKAINQARADISAAAGGVMTRGRVPKSCVAVERLALRLWTRFEIETGRDEAKGFVYGATVHPDFRDVEARMFGAGQVLNELGQNRAAADAFFLASLAGHLARGDLPLPSQSDFATAEGGGWLNGCRSL